jgi:hypothetical protein
MEKLTIDQMENLVILSNGGDLLIMIFGGNLSVQINYLLRQFIV